MNETCDSSNDMSRMSYSELVRRTTERTMRYYVPEGVGVNVDGPVEFEAYVAICSYQKAFVHFEVNTAPYNVYKHHIENWLLSLCNIHRTIARLSAFGISYSFTTNLVDATMPDIWELNTDNRQFVFQPNLSLFEISGQSLDVIRSQFVY